MKSIVPIDNHEYHASEKLPREEIQLVISYIDSHISDPSLTIEKIAVHAKISLHTLEYWFKKHKGISVVHYIRDLRLDEVARQLLKSDDFINRIATTFGFRDIPYFNKEFKRRYGMSPGRFRKNDKLLSN